MKVASFGILHLRPDRLYLKYLPRLVSVYYLHIYHREELARVFFSIPQRPFVFEASGGNVHRFGPRYGIKALSCVHLSSVINRYEIMRPQFVVLAAGSPLLEPADSLPTERGGNVLEEPGISMDPPL